MVTTERRLHLCNTPVIGPAEGIDFLQELEFARDRDVRAWGLDWIEIGGGCLGPVNRHAGRLRTTAGNLPGRMGRDFQRRDRDLVGKRVTRFLPGHRPHAHALIDVFRGLFHQPFFQRHGITHFILKIEVCIVDLLPQRLAEDALQTGGVHAIFVIKEFCGPGKGLRHGYSFIKAWQEENVVRLLCHAIETGLMHAGASTH